MSLKDEFELLLLFMTELEKVVINILHDLRRLLGLTLLWVLLVSSKHRLAVELACKGGDLGLVRVGEMGWLD
jgi:hypothetical protein